MRAGALGRAARRRRDRERPLDEDELTRRFAGIAARTARAHPEVVRGKSGRPGPRDSLAAGLVLGIGDDAAVLRPEPHEDLVWTLDALEEGVDFRRSWLSPGEVGQRAVAVTLSDLAAMAARPVAVLLALGTAGPDRAGELLGLFRGAAAAARRFGVPLAGGDVTRRAAGVGAVVTALGATPRARALRRDGARPGDELWVTGRLGQATAGRRLLERLGRERAWRRDHASVSAFVRPTPRLAEALWLRERGELHAGIDLSDGIGRDLTRLCAASGVGAQLDAADLPRQARGAAGLRDALYGGEDFELLVAAAPSSLDPLAEEFHERFGVGLTRIGQVTPRSPGAAVLLRTARGTKPVEPRGWDHLVDEPTPRKGERP